MCANLRNSSTSINRMQIQTQRVVVPALPATSRIIRLRVPSNQGQLQAFSSVSNSFSSGKALCARPVRHVSSRVRRQSARADVFFTQKTVPDQTGRVAIVTGRFRVAWLPRSTLVVNGSNVSSLYFRQFFRDGLRGSKMFVPKECRSHHRCSKSDEM